MSSAKQGIALRVRVAFMAVCVVVLAIFLRLINIQWTDGNRWGNLAEQNGFQYRDVKPMRGSIYAENDVLLATSVPLYRLSVDPFIIEEAIFKKDIDSLSVLLALHFQDKSAEEYKKKIVDARTAKKRYITLSPKYVTYQIRKEMMKWPIFREGQRKGGVLFERVNDRSYPFDVLGARTVGYVNDRDEGVVGLEYSFNQDLAGKMGRSLYQRISGGEWKPVNDGTQIKPVDGFDIYTTLDMNIQEIATTHLREALVEYEANFGCVIVMEVETGYIKALVNLGREEDGEYVEKYNYAIGDQGSTDPGSTFKLASMAAVLEDNKLLDLNDTLNIGNGTYNYYGRVMRDAGGTSGNISLLQAFQYSSSVGVSKLVMKQFGNRPQAYINYLYKFGLATPLNFQLAGEARPYIKNPLDPTWSAVTLPWMSVGYELKIAPIHTLTFFNAIANKGKLMQPILVKELKKANTVIKSFSPVIMNEKICSDTTLTKLYQMMEGVVQQGTARAIRDNKYRIAGKTGTSQKVKDGKYVKQYYTSFAGFFPAEAPKYSCIVVIDSPQGVKLSGGDVSAPVFKKIADMLYIRDLEMQKSILNLPDKSPFQVNIPEKNVVYAKDVEAVSKALSIPAFIQANAEWVFPVTKRYAIEWQEKNMLQNAVPSVIGMTLRDALFLLENKGFKVFFDGKGKVKSQSLMPGDKLPQEMKITLYLE